MGTPITYSWHVVAATSSFTPPPEPISEITPPALGGTDARKSQFARGIKFANVPGSRADFVVHGGPRVYHVNGVVNIIQDPSDKSNRSGVIETSDIVAHVMSAPSSSLLSSLQNSGSLNIRRFKLRRQYGETLGSEEAPSWTQVTIGKKHGHVIAALSSSAHESLSRNAYVTAPVALESTTVPASASEYYGKSSRFQKVLHKKEASKDLPVIPGNERDPSNVEYPSPRAGLTGSNYFHPVSGSYRNNSYYNPSVFEIEVPEYGKIRDVRVWVEFIHDHRGGTGVSPTGSSNPHWNGGVGSISDNPKHGLQGVQVALRSPNVHFKYAHPLWNDNRTFGFQKRPDPTISDDYRQVPELLKNSYLLWAGHRVEDDLGIALGAMTSSRDPNIGRNDETWGKEFIEYSNAGDTSTAIDNRGITHIAYRSSATGLKYTRRDSATTGWTFNVVQSIADGGYSPSLVIDAANNPHVSYYNVTGLSLMYATSGTSGWVSGSVASNVIDGTELSNTSLVLSKSGVPILAFVDSIRKEIKVARSSSVGWTVESVSVYQSDSSEAPRVSLALDNDVPCIAFNELGPNYNLCFSRSGSDGWSTQVIDSVSSETGETPTKPVLKFGTDNIPQIAYKTGGNDAYGEFSPSVRLIVSGSSGWTRERVTVDLNSFGSDIAFDLTSDNRPYILCSDGDDLRFARKTSYGRWALEHLTSSSNIVTNLSLDVDDDDYPRATFVNGEGGVSQLLHISGSGYVSVGQSYFSYDTDVDMRTVFTDSSRVPNPRHIQFLYDNPRLTSPGQSLFPTELVYMTKYSSPLSGALELLVNVDASKIVADRVGWMTGANVPWYGDSRIPPGIFANWLSLDQTVPSGWLNGPSGSAGTGEFLTSGRSIGPDNIQPVYPLLDDVYVEKIFDEIPSGSVTDVSSPLGSGFFPLSPNRSKLIGYRPGLRGTEVHGKWQLMIGVNADYSGSEMVGGEKDGIWFRQFRLEFTLDTGVDEQPMIPSRKRRYERTSHVPGREGRRIINILSGSAAWDIGINYTYVEQHPEYGRSIGITDQTASFSDSFAVFTRLTGALADSLSGTAAENAYLRNEFGTPYIPLSSGSGVSPSFKNFNLGEDARARRAVIDVLSPQTNIPAANNIQSYLGRFRKSQITRDIILERIQSFTGSLD